MVVERREKTRSSWEVRAEGDRSGFFFLRIRVRDLRMMSRLFPISSSVPQPARGKGGNDAPVVQRPLTHIRHDNPHPIHRRHLRDPGAHKARTKNREGLDGLEGGACLLALYFFVLRRGGGEVGGGGGGERARGRGAEGEGRAGGGEAGEKHRVSAGEGREEENEVEEGERETATCGPEEVEADFQLVRKQGE